MIPIQPLLADPESAKPAHVKSSANSALRIITLDRPNARNAIDATMTSTLATTIAQTARDPNAYAIVLRSGTPGMFCAGGDVREMAHLAATEPDAARHALAAEYQLIWLLECFSKPVVSLIDGAVMGAGAGMTLVNTHRVAGERYAFAMPEVRLGFFPDDGVASVLGRMPGEIGVFLGLTGRSIGRDDAYALGLVTHCIDARHFPDLERGLADAEPVDPLLDGLHIAPQASPLEAHKEQIAHYFSAPTVPEIVARLSSLRDRRGRDPEAAWVQNVLDDLARACPLALAIALRHIRDSRSMDLRQTLTLDYRLGRRLIGSHNFQEGVRALMIDKNRAPVWRPTTSGDITTTQIENLFQTDPAHELNLLTRFEMQEARV